SVAAAERNWSALEARVAAGDLGPDLDPAFDSPVEFSEAARSSAGGGAFATKVGVLLRPVFWLGLGIAGAGLTLLLATRSSEESKSASASASASASEIGRDESLPSSEQSQVGATPDQVSPGVTAPDPGEVQSAPVLEQAVSAASAEPTTADASAHRRVAQPDGAPVRRTGSRAERDGAAGGPDAAATPDAAGAQAAAPDLLGPEMELMSSARAALGRGDARRALELLEEHAKRFGAGVFVREREMSRITALCALGRQAEARSAATRF